MRSEIRDEFRQKQAQGFAQNLELLIEAKPQEVVASASLNVADGPRPVQGRRPTEKAWQLAEALLADALPRAGQSLRSLGLETLGPFTIDPEPHTPNEARALGFPILGALSAHACYVMSRVRVAHELVPFNPERRQLARNLSAILFWEHYLWHIAAAEQGAIAKEIPYAYRYRALGWLWHPDAHHAQRAYTLCLRCGALLERKKRPSDNPSCSHCAKNPGKWPEHAIAPAGRGTWWLTCQHPGPAHIFLGRAQARHCDEHRASRMTPSKRRTAAAV